MATRSRRRDSSEQAGAARKRSRAAAAEAEDAAAEAGPNGAARFGDGVFENVGSVSTAVAVGVGAALIEAELIPGILIGAGAVLLGRMFPQIAATLRPVVKTAIRTGLVMADKAREVAAEAGEQVQDMVAEVQAERAQAEEARPRRRRGARAAAAEAAAA